MLKTSKEQKFELALEKKKQIETIKNIEQQKVDLLKKFDQDVLAIVTDKNKENSLIQVLNIQKGVIIGKSEYRFDYYDNELLKEFLKLYYSKNSVPREILLNEELYINPNEEISEKENIEKYLEKFRQGKVLITVPKRGEKMSLIKLAIKNAQINLGDENIITELQNKLKLPNKPKIIECFDISNFGDFGVVAGMTQFINGQANKRGYRKFEMKSFTGQNDFLAIKEVIYRRYSRLKSENKEMPNLIIIDGGKGQLGMAIESLRELNLKIPIIGLAKREEEIFMMGYKEPLIFDKNSKMMLFVRHIRNSTHNLVINYNRKKREMKMREEMGE